LISWPTEIFTDGCQVQAKTFSCLVSKDTTGLVSKGYYWDDFAQSDFG